jgi:hypothetical protein
MYRAQRLAEYALYDSDPQLLDTELDHYLSVTADEIKNAVARYLDVDNRVVLDIVPAPAAEHAAEAAASPQPPGEPSQPASPASQVPGAPRAEPAASVHVEVPEIKPVPPSPDKPQDPADVPPRTKSGSGPLHP